MGTEMVNIYVGDPEKDEEKHFIVHKELLCNKVPYFEKMFKGGFAEAKTNTAKFPEDDPEAFDVLLDWLYGGSLPPVTRTLREGEENLYDMSWDWQDVFVLADKLCIPELMDVTMDFCREYDYEENSFPALESIEQGYKITSAGSVLRKYLAMSCAYLILNKSNTWSLQDLSELSVKIPELNRDIMEIMREQEGAVEDPRELPDCDFHSHPKDIHALGRRPRSSIFPVMGTG
jgi:hypothetical protein